jgi:hypothetical protein
MEEQHVSDTGTTDQGKQPTVAQKKRTRKTTQDTQDTTIDARRLARLCCSSTSHVC